MSIRKPPADRLDGHTLQPNEPTDPAKDPEVKALVKRSESGGVLAKFARVTMDGFRNLLTGIGDPNRDKTYGGGFGGSFGGATVGVDFLVRLLAGSECEDRWRGSDLGARIVETVPSEMTREGFELAVQPTEEEDEGGYRGDGWLGADSPSFTRTLERRAAARARNWRDKGLRDRRMRRDAAAPAVAANQQAMRPTAGPLPATDDEGPAIVEALEAKLRDLGVLPAALEALQYERAYGGGAVFIGADDGVDDLTQPLDESRIKSIKHLTPFRGGWDGELIAWRYYNDPRSPRFGEPEIYMLRNLGVPIAHTPAPGETIRETPPVIPMGPTGARIFYVHESRLLIFPGTAVSRRVRVQMRGWGDSVFTRVDEVLMQYGQTWGSIANLMTDWAQGVLKIDGLADMLAATGPDGQPNTAGNSALANRMLQINLNRSVARTLLIDKEEEFKREVTPLSGLAEVLQQFCLRMAAAADMPVTLLMGQSPAGLNATGESDIRFFYDRIASKQRERLLPQLHRLVRLLFLAKDSPTGGKEPEKWSIKMRPLWQRTAKEEADMRLVVAQADQIYLTNQVLTPAEVAASAYGGSKWSMERTIDLKSREAMLFKEPVPGDEQGQNTDPEGQNTDPSDPNAPPTGDKEPESVDLTATALAGIVTVNEARHSRGLPKWPDADGELTIAEFQAKRSKTVAAAANAESGKVGEPPQADKPPPPKFPPAGAQSGPPGSDGKGKPPFAQGKKAGAVPQNDPSDGGGGNKSVGASATGEDTKVTERGNKGFDAGDDEI